jgi:hypothetical protein
MLTLLINPGRPPYVNVHMAAVFFRRIFWLIVEEESIYSSAIKEHAVAECLRIDGVASRYVATL